MLEVSPVVARPLLVDLQVSVAHQDGGDLKAAVSEKAVGMTALGPNAMSRAGLKLSVHRGKPQVVVRAEQRDRTGSDILNVLKVARLELHQLDGVSRSSSQSRANTKTSSSVSLG
jgi:hypothetical protein